MTKGKRQDCFACTLAQHGPEGTSHSKIQMDKGERHETDTRVSLFAAGSWLAAMGLLKAPIYEAVYSSADRMSPHLTPYFEAR